MNNNNINKLVLIAIVALINLMPGCKKQSNWLDKKSIKSTVVPQTLNDFQAILDNTGIFNTTRFSTAGLASSDNHYLTDEGFSASLQVSRNLYTWNKEIWPTINSGDWDGYYVIIEHSNIILDGLKKVNSAGLEYNNIKGQALFHRAFAFYNLAQLFCKAYAESANLDLGLPIRTTSDVNNILQRSSLEDTYKQIISDALQAGTLLSNSQVYFRPVNTAAFALLSKTYLNIGDYFKAEEYANKAINQSPALVDFNNTAIVNPNTTYRFPAYSKNNPELLFYAESGAYPEVSPTTSSTGIIAPELYQLYETNDLRKSVFFVLSNTTPKFRGSYTGRLNNFCGLATNEVYLIRAECLARQNKLMPALEDINKLLTNRYKTGLYIPLIGSDIKEVLEFILKERRKELAFVGNIRWEDLRRLNKETPFQKNLTRLVNGVTYTLNPNDNRYVFPIPTAEIQSSSIKQNER